MDLQLHPTPEQARTLSGQLEAARRLYNACVRAGRERLAREGRAPTRGQLIALAGDACEATGLEAAACRLIALRVAAAFESFAAGSLVAPASPPAERARGAFDSFAYPLPCPGVGPTPGGIELPGAGPVATDPPAARIPRRGTLTLRRAGPDWSAVLTPSR